MLFLFFTIALGEMCIFQRSYSDAACTNMKDASTGDAAIVDTLACKKNGGGSQYFKGTCDSDGSNMKVWRTCDTDSCDDGATDLSCPTEGEAVTDACEKDSIRDGTWTKYFCGDCEDQDFTDCALLNRDGDRANPTCSISTVKPITSEMCVYKQRYSDSDCSTEVTDSYHLKSNGVMNNECIQNAAGRYDMGTCDDDGNISIWENCDNDICNDGWDSNICPPNGKSVEKTCTKVTGSTVDMWEQITCGPCKELDCQMDLNNGRDANPSCSPKAGPAVDPPAAGNCLVKIEYTDETCSTMKSAPYQEFATVYTEKAKTPKHSDGWFKGICTADKDGNLVTGRQWFDCETEATNDGADDMTCPTDGDDIMPYSDCQMDDGPSDFYRYECLPCNELPCPAQYANFEKVPSNMCRQEKTGDGNTGDGNTGDNKDSSASTMTVFLGLGAFLFLF